MLEARRQRILVVDDEMLVAMLVEDMVIALGHEVVGPALTLPRALSLAASAEIDGAILDVNLGEEVRSDAVATALAARGIPFLYATGYGESGIAAAFKDAPVLDKPFSIEALGKALRAVIAARH